MLVVTDQVALGVSRQRRLARPRKAKQERRTSGLFVGGGRPVHREDHPLWRKIIRHRKDPLIHFAGVLGTKDDEFTVFQAKINAGFGTHARREPVSRKGARVEDDEVRFTKVRKLLVSWSDEHGVHEKRVIWPRADDPDLDLVIGIPAGEAIKAVKPLAGVEVIAGALAIDGERMWLERDVDGPPPDFVFGNLMLDHPLVLGRAARLNARVRYQSPVVGNARFFLVADRVFVKCAA
jgi:hypothetical protein